MTIFPRDEKGNVFVVSAPSGTGKTTLVNALLLQFPKELTRSVSCTTRPCREGEIEGVDYKFISENEFETHCKNGDFLEFASIYEYKYGTLNESIAQMQKSGQHVFLVIDVQGAKEIRGKLEATFIFICPPSMQELERRIKGRKQDSPEMIDKRLRRAEEEMKERYHYDYILINDNEQTAIEVLKSIVVAQSYKNKAKL